MLLPQEFLLLFLLTPFFLNVAPEPAKLGRKTQYVQEKVPDRKIQINSSEKNFNIHTLIKLKLMH